MHINFPLTKIGERIGRIFILFFLTNLKLATMGQNSYIGLYYALNSMLHTNEKHVTYSIMFNIYRFII